jgi:endo-1,3(4)-beta-glucanase
MLRHTFATVGLTLAQLFVALTAAAPQAPPELASTHTVRVSTSLARQGIVQILPALTSAVPDTSGTIHTALPTSDGNLRAPVISTRIPTPTSLIQPAPPAKLKLLAPAQTQTASPPAAFAMAANVDIFDGPIGSGRPAGMAVEPNHPVPRLGLTAGAGPIQTNKFFANFFLGDQRMPSYTFPYAVNWAGGTGHSGSYGMAISHIEPRQWVFGPQKYGAASYYINPVGIQYLAISAKELGRDTALTTANQTAFSARVELAPNRQTLPVVSFPLVQGMAFVTALFHGGTPLLQSGVFFKTVTRVNGDPKRDVAKFNVVLEDNSVWRVYAYRTAGAQLDLRVVNNGYALAAGKFYGVLQVCKDPGGDAERVYDAGAGVYPVDMDISGSAGDQTRGTYSFTWQSEGHPQGDLVMFALPHHVESFDGETRGRLTTVRLQTPTKGVAVAVRGERWTMAETLPSTMGFAPWSATRGPVTRLSADARAAIRDVAQREMSQDMAAQTDLDSMYFAGKALAKFAQLVWVVHTMLGDRALAQPGLDRLKAAFARFAQGRNKYPLVYDASWGGVVSSASHRTGDPNVDFGNTYYNDHHFHYGYHILTAAMIGHMDPSWVGPNKAYVDALVRDVANPAREDAAFPTWRCFDWYHGHSWAHGLYASMDGKNQESSSEDVMSAFALKMWGSVSGDTKMAARGNLQLAVLARSLSKYYYMARDNNVQPSSFIGNKVAGILFENKADHTTFFDPSIEAVQGIHMIPILAPTGYVRRPAFVQEEWDAFFSRGRIDGVNNLWRGIVLANYAIANPRAAWDFFSRRDFNDAWIDGGASRAWFMAYAGGEWRGGDDEFLFWRVLGRGVFFLADWVL